MGNSDLIYQLKFIQAKYKLVFVQNLALGSSVSIPGKVINKYIFTGSINSKRILFNLTLMLSALSEKHTYFFWIYSLSRVNSVESGPIIIMT